MKKNILLPVLFLIVFALFNGCNKKPRVVEGDIRDVILQNKHPYFNLDVKDYPQKDKTLPIGIFDSGTAGWLCWMLF